MRPIVIRSRESWRTSFAATASRRGPDVGWRVGSEVGFHEDGHRCRRQAFAARRLGQVLPVALRIVAGDHRLERQGSGAVQPAQERRVIPNGSRTGQPADRAEQGVRRQVRVARDHRIGQPAVLRARGDAELRDRPVRFADRQSDDPIVRRPAGQCGTAGERQVDRLAHLRPGGYQIRPLPGERTGIDLERGVGPVAVVLHLEDLALQPAGQRQSGQRLMPARDHGTVIFDNTPTAVEGDVL